MPSKPEDVDLIGLLPSWELALRAERKSPQTIRSYLNGVHTYFDYCADSHLPVSLDRRVVAAFTATLLDKGLEPATARARQLAVRRYSAWLAYEGELDADPLLGVKAPKLDVKIVEPLTDDQLRALVKACSGKELRDRRDEAIVRLMTETTIRAGECVGLTVGDIDFTKGTAIVRRGKGGKGRIVPFGPEAALALDRYLRLRKAHRLASTSALWLGDRGKGFDYDALYWTLRYRAGLAGIEGFHPHQLRHTGAHRWLERGGSESGLMAVAGWARPDMLMRYTRARATDRAIAEARNLNLGDL